MKHLYSFLLCLLLLVAGYIPAQSQQLWTRSYGPASSLENFDGVTALRDGSVLLMGREVRYTGSTEIFPRLYLVRINAQGDTLWTRRQAIRTFTGLRLPNVAADDNAGRILVAIRNFDTSGTSNLVVMLNGATGDTLWTRPLEARSIWLGTDHNFVVAGAAQGHTQLTRLSATGQVLQQIQADYSATEAGSLAAAAAVPGGSWLILSSGSGAQKAVYFSEAGVRGPEYPGSFGNPTSFLPVENGNFLTLSGNSLVKYSPAFAQLWSRQIASPSPFSFSSAQAHRNTSGEYVVLGRADVSSHSMAGYLVRYDAQGSLLGTTQVFSDNAGIIMSTRFVVAPGTGTYYIGYGVSNLKLVAWAGAGVTATTPAAAWAGQLYPNPIGAGEALHLTVPTALRDQLTLTDLLGQVVRRWPAQPAATRYELPLQGLGAGLYQLHLTTQQGKSAVLRVVRN